MIDVYADGILVAIRIPSAGRFRPCESIYAGLIRSWSGGISMPRLSDLAADKVATWGDQIEKDAIAHEPFWIHNIRESDYTNDEGHDVELYILDITLRDASRKAPRAVITLGRTEDRAPFYSYFQEGNTDPIGPCVLYQVSLRGGRTFWRLEDAPTDEDVAPLNLPAKRAR
jgi:hypothetical protein